MRELNGITAFVQSAEAGSFALAAARMQLTRSAVGKSIARLERHLGVRLFHRTTRRQSLTEDGQAYYERCTRALAELDAAESTLAAARRVPSGKLRVSAPVVFGRHCVSPILVRLARKNPRLSIEISFSDRVVDLVEDGFDLAIRIGALKDSASLTARLLGRQRMAICAAPSYLEEHGCPTTVAELNGHTAIVYGRAGTEYPWRVRDGGELRQPRLKASLHFDDLQAIADAAVAGAGLACLPCYLLAPHVRTGQLKMVMDSERAMPTDVYAVWPRSQLLSSKTRAAIDALAAAIPGMLD